jgi:membrane associated rhomboid family serine protease
MANLSDELLFEVLKACAQSASDPLYPAAFAAYSGLDRSLLDEALDHLRLRGLVRLTEWAQGKGQGYALTSEGALVLQNPPLLKRARLTEPVPALAAPSERSDSPWERGEAVRETLLNPIRPIVCMTLLALNLLMFALGMFLAWQRGVGLNEYLSFGGNRQVAQIHNDLGSLDPIEVLRSNQWWRLLSCAFVHGGLLHLMMNMYFLFSLGPLLETMWGSVRFLVLYVVGAWIASCAAMLTMRGGLGASGALCGLLTSLGVWVYLNRSALPPNVVSNWMRNVFINIVLMAFISALPGISWEGHLGGAIGGAVVSVALNYQRFGRGWQKILGSAGVIAVPLVASALVLDILGPLSTYLNADAQATYVCNKVAVPLLNTWNDDLPKSDLDAARDHFLETKRRTEAAATLLKRFDSSRDVRLAGDYFAEWSEFFGRFAKVAEEPRPWAVEQKQALVDQLGKVTNLRGVVRDAAIRQALHK